MSAIFAKITAFICSIIISICVWLDIPMYPMGEKLDMDKFVIQFEDEFEGELDRTVWSGHYQWGSTTEARRGCYWNKYLAYTENGNLVIPVTYLAVVGIFGACFSDFNFIWHIMYQFL